MGRALLCLDATAAELAMDRHILGKPMLFHQIKQLQRIGFGELAVAVETIPAGLPALLEQFRADGLLIKLSRSGQDVAAFAAGAGRVLVKDASIWLADDILLQLLSGGGRQIAVVPEGPALGAFERIDLNRRWAGAALLDATLLQQSANLPEGWSLASFLLRSAVQAGCSDLIIELRDGASIPQHLSTAQTPVLERALRPERAAMGMIDRGLFALADKAVGRWGAGQWYKPLASCSYSTLAITTLILAFFEYYTASCLFFFLSILASVWRRHTHLVEYRPSGVDRVAVASSAVLTVALVLQLLEDATPADALFFAGLASGLLWLQRRTASRSRAVLEISPVLLVGLWSLGYLAGFGIWALKASIIAILASLLVPSRLNPN